MSDLVSIVKILIAPIAEMINNIFSNLLYNTPKVFGMTFGGWVLLFFGLSILFRGIFDND